MKNTIRICMLGSDLTVRGGMSTVVSQLLDHRWSRDVQIEYVPTHTSGSIVRKCLTFLRGYLRLWGILHRRETDLIHMHMSERGSFYRKYLACRLAKRHGVPVIVHLHGAEFMEFYEGSTPREQARIREMLRLCDRILVLGGNWERNIRGIEPKARVQILRNAVDPIEQHPVWRDDRTELCYMGVLIRRKGVEDLIRALALLVQRYPEKPIHLTIIGEGDDRPRLEQLCRSLHLQDAVTFTGWTTGEGKLRMMLDSQCFILPSYNEGLPMVVLEAISYGLPVVATNVGSMDEAILDGENGRLIAPGDPEQLADAIRWVTADPDRWERLSQSARDVAHRKFDKRQIFEQLEQLYFDLAGEALQEPPVEP